MSGVEIGDPGGVRDDENLAPDAPAKEIDNEEEMMSPAGMELTFETPTATSAAVYEAPNYEPPTPEPEYADPYTKEQKRTTFEEPARTRDTDQKQPKQFREQFDQLMKRLEDRFQNERLSLEEKHCRELEEAMGYFSLSSNEREAKQQELQFSLLEDIGNMAQQLQELTGALGSDGDAESLTLPSDPKILEDYANKMQLLEDQFQSEKEELEKRQAREMEEALGTIKMSREQREAKQLELQDEISAEIGDMAKQLEELNQAKEAYESKMGMLKQQLSKDESSKKRAPEDPKLRSISDRLRNVENERDAAQEELRRLKLALKVSHGDPPTRYTQPVSSPAVQDKLSPLEQNNISSLRGRIDQMEKELKEAAQTPGGSDTMKSLRERMRMIERDLEAAEDSTKEHFALGHLRARMEKVEKLLTEGERAAKDWEALEELREKIGNVDNDLKAVEEAKKEFEALELLRSKMEAVEDELKIAERLATDRENVDKLRRRLVQVERELGVAEPAQDDPSSIDKLLDRLARAESSLQDARESTMMAEKPYSMPASSSRAAAIPTARGGQNKEVEMILERLAMAETKLSAAKESAQLRNPNTSSGYPNFPTSQRSQPEAANRPFTPFDEREAKIRSRLQDHFQETGTYSDPMEREQPRRQARASSNPRAFPETRHYDPPSKGDDPRAYVGASKEREYFKEPLRTMTFDDGTIPSQEPYHMEYAEEKYSRPRTGQAPPASDRPGTTRPLQRRYVGEPPDTTIRPSKSMPHSVLGDEGDRYKADLEELRYQRALLSQKLPRNRFEDEEKKSDDSSNTEQKYSWRDAIRNEERQRLKERMNPRLGKKQDKVDSSVRESKDETDAAVKLPDEEDEAKVGGDPPIKPGALPTGDPPPQMSSLETDLKSRIKSQPKKSPGLEPREGGGPSRSEDPPAHLDRSRFDTRGKKPPSSSTRNAETKGIKPVDQYSVSTRGDENSTAYSKDASSRPDASVSGLGTVTSSEAEPKGKQWWESSGNNEDEEPKPEPPPSPAPEPEVPPPPPRQEPSHARVQQEPEAPPPPPPKQNPSLPPPPPPPPRKVQAPEPPPSPQSVRQPEQSYAVQSPPSPEPQRRQEPPPSEPSPRVSTPPPLSPSTIAPSPAPAPPVKPPAPATQPPAAAPAITPVPQQPILYQTTVVDGKAAARERRQKDRLMRWMVLILLCIAIILAVVIIVAIVLLRDNDGDDKIADPTPPPTPEPTVTSSPAPSMSPTREALMPTYFSACPELKVNRPLATDGVISKQDTIGASFNAAELGGLCGVISEPNDDGVWYALIGAGETVTVSTCTLFYPSFDTQLMIFKPVNQTQGCRSGLDCVASNDNFCGLQSSVTFAAQFDMLYFIYVTGEKQSLTGGMNASEGEFSLTVSASPEGSCQGAFALDVAPANLLPVIMVENLLGGTFGIDPCNPGVETRTGELWYKVVGTGQVLVASTCHSASNFEARLAVYRGECDDLLCITAEDEDCGNGSQLSWFAEKDKEYFLLVYSPDFVPDATFGITVQEAA